MSSDGPHPAAPNPVSLLTPRLLLTAGRDGDAEALFPFVRGDAGRAVTDTLLWDGPESLDALRDVYSQYATGTFADFGWHWIVRDRSGEVSGVAGTPLGAIGMTATGVPGRVELGYWIGPTWWGRGLMAEAVDAVTRFAFGGAGACRVEAEVFAHNERGLRLLERLGFEREGLRRRGQRKRGAWVDVVLFGRIADRA